MCNCVFTILLHLQAALRGLCEDLDIPFQASMLKYVYLPPFAVFLQVELNSPSMLVTMSLLAVYVLLYSDGKLVQNLLTGFGLHGGTRASTNLQAFYLQ